jgi:PAS domain S-box-containing protein
MQSTNQKNNSILVINADEDSKSIIQRVLFPNLAIHFSTSAEEGLAIINSEHPDLILCAASPNDGEIKMLQKISASAAHHEIPLILISASEQDEENIPSDVIADDYLTKPFSSKKLLACVKTRLNIKRVKQNAHEQLINLFNQAPNAITILYGPDFIVHHANALMLEQWGREAAQVIGRPLAKALPEIEGQGFIELLKGVYKTGERYVSMEQPALLSRHGKLEEIYVSFVFEPFRDLDGEIQGVMAISREVTELVLAQKAAIDYAEVMEAQVALRVEELMRKNALIKEQKEFAESIINSSIVLISVLDIDTKFLSFNNKCEEAFNVKKENVLGKKFTDAFPELEGTVAHDAIRHALMGETVHTEIYKSEVNGRYYESFTTPLWTQSGKVYAVIVTAHDISIIIESSEKLLRSNEELIRKNDELEQFAYISSHDLQEPLRKIQTFSELVSSNINNETFAKRYLGKIEKSASRMSALIKAVLAYSSISATDKQFENVDLNVLIDSLREDFELRIEQTGAIIRHKNLPVIRAISAQIQQLFANLISNSLKFCEQKPVIEITAHGVSADEKVVLNLDKKIEYIAIQVRDNGIGFDQEYADKIFTIFQRLNHKVEYEGTGIGLALCKKIAENHAGLILAESKVGEGTAFKIYLPA